MAIKRNNSDNERKIQKKLALLLWKNSEVIVNNMVFDHWNNDLMNLTKAGFINEFEIKCTVADFYNDFSKALKHKIYEQSESIGSNIGNVPNFFWYVMKDYKMAKKIEKDIPEYAGLMLPTGYIIKKAPKIHNEKCSEYMRENMWKRLKSAYWFRNLRTEADLDAVDDLIESRALDLSGRNQSFLDEISNTVLNPMNPVEVTLRQISFILQNYYETK